MNKLKVFLVVSAVFTLLSAVGCASSSPQPQPQAQTQAPSKPYVEPPLPQGGIAVEGESLIDKLTWLETYAESGNIYILEISADENIAPRTLEYDGVNDITIIIRGVGENRTVRLSANGTMFTVKPTVKLILDNNITLMGHNRNTGPVVHVDGGNLWMRTGSCISGNNRDTSEIEGEIRATGNGGGVFVSPPGQEEFVIYNKKLYEWAEDVVKMIRKKEPEESYPEEPVLPCCGFLMTGGTISGNTADSGGGVFGQNITMHGGTISGNIANNGGGVFARKMHDDGTISVNSNGVDMALQVEMVVRAANLRGLKLTGGTISGNTARVSGGGVYGIFAQFGGTISGNTAGVDNDCTFASSECGK
jgi:hypothetical protein